MRLFDAPRNQTKGSFSQQAPVLDAAFQEDSSIFLAGLDGIIKRCCSNSSPSYQPRSPAAIAEAVLAKHHLEESGVVVHAGMTILRAWRR